MKARDFSEIALAVCTLYKHQLKEDLHNAKNPQALHLHNEVKLIARRTATVLSKMTPLGRDIVYGAFSQLKSFYEPNLHKAFAKHNLIKKK